MLGNCRISGLTIVPKCTPLTISKMKTYQWLLSLPFKYGYSFHLCLCLVARLSRDHMWLRGRNACTLR